MPTTSSVTALQKWGDYRSHWSGIRHGCEVELDSELQALVLGLPWQRVGADGAITVL